MTTGAYVSLSPFPDAAPARKVLAGAIDWTLMGVLVTAMFSLQWSALVLLAVPAYFVLGAWLGCTLGDALAGVTIVDEGTAHHPGPWEAAVRGVTQVIATVVAAVLAGFVVLIDGLALVSAIDAAFGTRLGQDGGFAMELVVFGALGAAWFVAAAAEVLLAEVMPAHLDPWDAAAHCAEVRTHAGVGAV